MCLMYFCLFVLPNQILLFKFSDDIIQQAHLSYENVTKFLQHILIRYKKHTSYISQKHNFSYSYKVQKTFKRQYNIFFYNAGLIFPNQFLLFWEEWIGKWQTRFVLVLCISWDNLQVKASDCCKAILLSCGISSIKALFQLKQVT